MTRPFPAIGRGLAASLCVFLAACASDPVSLAVRVPAGPPAVAVAAPVAFVHSKAFREDVRAVEPYGNRYYLPLRVGEGSDSALRAAYRRVFANARELEAPDQATTALPPPVVTLEPSIRRFDYVNASGRPAGPFYSEIVYAFALHDPSGAQIAQWQVTGFGEFDMDREARERRPDLPRGETAALVEAARRAVENGVAGFVAGFDRVPELIRLARDQPLAGANAPAEAQVTTAAASTADASYPGTLALRIELASMPSPPAELAESAPSEPPVLPLRVALRNLGPHRLALDPADFQWLPPSAPAGAEPVSPLPAPVLSALLSGRPFGLTVGVMSPGVGMLPALLAGLLSAAENERQRLALAAWTAAIRRDLLAGGVAAPGATRGGVVYLPRPSGARGGVLVVPVVDLDQAVRYTVRVPLPAGAAAAPAPAK